MKTNYAVAIKLCKFFNISSGKPTHSPSDGTPLGDTTAICSSSLGWAGFKQKQCLPAR